MPLTRQRPTAVLKVLTDVLLAIDTGDLSALVLLDLSAAFDMVDHNFLIRQLRTSYDLSRLVYSSGSSHILPANATMSSNMPL